MEYFEKPYLLVPGKRAEKGYVLLRETLKRTGMIGIARIVIRTHGYLSAVMPRDDALMLMLMLMLMRYPLEWVSPQDYTILQGDASSYAISPKEVQMAKQLIESMSDSWNPDNYHNKFNDRLRKVIEDRLMSNGVVTPPDDKDAESPDNASTNVVDFMALLQKSLASDRRTPAKKSAAKESAGKETAGGKAAKTASKNKHEVSRQKGFGSQLYQESALASGQLKPSEIRTPASRSDCGGSVALLAHHCAKAHRKLAITARAAGEHCDRQA